MSYQDVVKDSGKRQEFKTGSKRDTRDGKGRFDLLPYQALFEIARIFEEGAKKYGDSNWKKGQPLSRYLDSAMRHGFKVLGGWKDENHAAMASWNWIAFIETRDMIAKGELPEELDDIGWLRASKESIRKET